MFEIIILKDFSDMSYLKKKLIYDKEIKLKKKLIYDY